MPSDRRNKKKTYMGEDTGSIVYFAGLQDITLALQITGENRPRRNTRATVIIYTAK